MSREHGNTDGLRNTRRRRSDQRASSGARRRPGEKSGAPSRPSGVARLV
jgi:hypothetical protein